MVTQHKDIASPHRLRESVNITKLLMFITTSLITLISFSVFAHRGQPLNAGPLDVQIIDAGHSPLPSYHHQGKFYILGRHHQRYMIKVTNPTGRRYEVVLTVDGRDVVNGQPGAYHHRGYVVDPYDQIEVEGFRRSSDEVATFRFTTSRDSYASRMGSGQNIGVIGVAVFAERVRPHRHHSFVPPSPRADLDHSHFESSGAGGALSDSRSRALTDRGSKRAVRRRSPQSEIGTQYGERRHSATQETSFIRTSSTPTGQLMITYDSERGLRRRGVLYGNRHSHYTPLAFPGESGYAPPPPRHH